MPKIASLLLVALMLCSSCRSTHDSQGPTSKPASSAAAKHPASNPTTQPAVFAQATAAWIDPPTYTLEDLARRWPFFQHKPFEDGGFNQLTLPFRYEDPDHMGDGSEALAFSFLLSNALDWTPGCYCTRHAYFVFKRSARQMQPLAKEYSQERIVASMRSWWATHAVGGVLCKTGVGYTGRLEVYDQQGEIILKKEYPQPRGYFDLLGDMAADFMRMRKYEPPEKLLAELRRVRCKDPESLVLLGQAAFAEERSDQEFGLYDEILRRDPGFAEVRYWSANQRQWMDEDRKTYAKQVRLAAQDYLTLNILDEIDGTAKDAAQPDQAALSARYTDRAEAMLGPDNPIVLKKRLWGQLKRGEQMVEALGRLTKLASQYPDDWWMLGQLSHQYSAVVSDRMMAACLAVAALQCPEVSGTGSKPYVATELGSSLLCMGYSEDAVSAMLCGMKEDTSSDKDEMRWNLACLADSWAALGHFDQAIDIYYLMYKKYPGGQPSQGNVLCGAAVFAAAAQKWNVVDQIVRDHPAEIAAGKVQPILDGYRHLAAGTPDLEALVPLLADNDWLWRHECALLVAQVEARSGTERGRDRVGNQLHYAFYRVQWIAYDLYDRQHPREESASFYETLGWLHGQDPWVMQAVADFHERSPNARSPAPEKVLAILRPYEPVLYGKPHPALAKDAKKAYLGLPVWACEAAIKRLLDSGQVDRAEELALRYNDMTMNVQDCLAGRAHSAYMVHMVRQAKEKGPLQPPMQANGKPASSTQPVDAGKE